MYTSAAVSADELLCFSLPLLIPISIPNLGALQPLILPPQLPHPPCQPMHIPEYIASGLLELKEGQEARCVLESRFRILVGVAIAIAIELGLPSSGIEGGHE